MSKYIHFIRNLFWILVGGASSKIVSFLMLPLYTRWLSPDEFGASDIIIVYATLMLGVVTLCLAEAIFVFPKEQEKCIQTTCFTSGLVFVLLLLILFAGLVCIYGLFANHWGWKGSFATYRWFIYALLVTNFIQSYTQQFACAINAIRVYSFTGLIQTVCIALFAFVFIPPYGVKGYILSIIFANIVAAVSAFVFSQSYRYFSLNLISIDQICRMLQYSIPLIPNSIMWWLVSSINRPLLEEYVGLFAIGIFAVSNKLPSLMNVVFGFFSQSWQISILEEYDKNGFSKYFNNVMKVVCVGLVACLIIISSLKEQILDIITTPEYSEAAMYVPLLCLGLGYSCVSGFLGSLFAAHKTSKYFFYSSMWSAITAIILNSLLIPLYGIWGAVIASAVSFVVMCIMRAYWARKYVEVTNIGFYIWLSVISIVFVIYDFQHSTTILFSGLAFLVLLVIVVLNADCRNIVKVLYVQYNKKKYIRFKR